ncbi:metallophosphoesterase family protein [Fundidesulfovibrio agrisoli]|uniref:metallophosphoesterase family protein n=1 Tax=Fundidesulfovibrio agrisoli TaxID=2922717 RepID=UPI001FAC989B|nr:metallophosphoesterase [Fundidesulfovibrio agrisoli]
MIVLSDIHANLEALEAVLADIRVTGAQGPLIFLGDMVGYGADPEAVVTRVRSLGALAVQGNHEAGVCDEGRAKRFNPVAWDVVRWTREHLGAESLEWLAGLPRFLSLDGCRLVHGMPPQSVDKYLFQTDEPEVRAIMENLKEPVSFVGHTHLLRLVSLGPDGGYSSKRLVCGERVLDSGARHLVNCGAVGQPRDGDCHAKYVVYNPATRELDVRFVAYDAQCAARKIVAAGLPATYAERLTDEPL